MRNRLFLIKLKTKTTAKFTIIHTCANLLCKRFPSDCDRRKPNRGKASPPGSDPPLAGSSVCFLEAGADEKVILSPEAETRIFSPPEGCRVCEEVDLGRSGGGEVVNCRGEGVVGEVREGSSGRPESEIFPLGCSLSCLVLKYHSQS